METLRYNRSLKKSVDWGLVICYVLLVTMGIIAIFASSHSVEDTSVFSLASRSGKQLLWFIGALILDVMILFAINPRLWEVITTPAYLLTLLLLVAVIFLGVEVKGSRSWFALGPLRFQPAELSKITTSLLLALTMSKPAFRLSNKKDLMSVALTIGIPMLAILAESETGSALVYVGFLFALYREGLSGWWLFFLGMAILLFTMTLITSWIVSGIVLTAVCACFALFALRQLKRRPKNQRINALMRILLAFLAGAFLIFATNFIFENVLQDHQRKRIAVLLGMMEDPSGVGYNVRQSMIAIGSGGLFGKGFLNGTQTAFGFVPEQSTDFIFCTIGEEFGFAGCLAVILMFCFLIGRIISDAERSRESFTRIYGYCLASCLFMHLFINIGMTIGLMPVIGIPLPFLSYGGSSLWAFSTMLFIFIALDHQEKKYF